MASFVIINGKKYLTTSANDAFKQNDSEELDKHFNDQNSSIDAKWTAHIKFINAQLKNAGEYKAGRPRKEEPQEFGMGM